MLTHVRHRFMAGMPALALSIGLSAVQGSEAQRLRPPPQVECSRDQLTSYAGEVQRYDTGPEQTVLLIRTDEQTQERVVIAHVGAKTPMARYLIEGRSFKASDLTVIEQAPGQLRPGVRAIAWVCGDGHQPLVDWYPRRNP